jgi:hypothetical protein
MEDSLKLSIITKHHLYPFPQIPRQISQAVFVCALVIVPTLNAYVVVHVEIPQLEIKREETQVEIKLVVEIKLTRQEEINLVTLI